MATSKKKDRIENMIQLRNTLAAGAPMSSPKGNAKLITFSAENHKILMKHIEMMLAQDGIFLLNLKG